MVRAITFRESLLRNVIAMMIVLGAAILLTMTIASRTSAKMLSRQIIDTSMQRADAQMRLFFDEVEHQLQIIADWVQHRPLMDLREEALRETNALLQPLLGTDSHLSTLMIADEYGSEWMLLRNGASWRNRLTIPTRYGVQNTDYDWSFDEPDPVPVVSTAPYDPRERPWFVDPMQSLVANPRAKRTAPHWTEPYHFFTTGEMGITASVGVRSRDGVNRVVAIDVLLRDLDRYTSGLRVSSNGYLFVLSPTGEFIALPHEGLFESREAMQQALHQPPSEVDVPLVRDALEALDDVVRPSAEAESEAVRFESEGSTWWGEVIAFPLSSERSLYLAVLVPEADLQGFMPVLRIAIAAIIAIALIAAVLRAFIVAGHYSEPIEQLVTDSQRLSAGNFEAGPPIQTRVREMRVLAGAHESMRDSLRSLVKLERDLLIARQIQQATLPAQMPSVDGYEIAAWNQPADETGGDTYDIVGLNERGEAHVRADEVGQGALLMLADATGHGVGPALSAMEIRSMFRMAARSGVGLHDITEHMNDQLVDDLPEGRFITTWLGRLDAREHTLQCFSAGHGPLLWFHAADSTWTSFEADAIPFGIMPGLDESLPPAITLDPGDMYAVISDGIFEACNTAGEQFGVDRTRVLLASAAPDGAAAALDRLRQEVAAFTRGTTQQDDQTVIIIVRKT